MSSNSTASSGGNTPCCKATTLLAVAATSFLLCFILVVAFLFLRFLLQRQRWRRRAMLLHLQRQPPPKLGLDAAAIALIPSFPYQGAADGAACPTTSGQAECAVCLGVLEEGQMARELLGCKHVFHRECIDVWLASRASCPVCRGNAEPARPPGERAVSSASTARVVAIEMFDDQVQASFSLFGWLVTSQPTVISSHKNQPHLPAANQPTVVFSHKNQHQPPATSQPMGRLKRPMGRQRGRGSLWRPEVAWLDDVPVR